MQTWVKCYLHTRNCCWREIKSTHYVLTQFIGILEKTKADYFSSLISNIVKVRGSTSCDVLKALHMDISKRVNECTAEYMDSKRSGWCTCKTCRATSSGVSFSSVSKNGLLGAKSSLSPQTLMSGRPVTKKTKLERVTTLSQKHSLMARQGSTEKQFIWILGTKYEPYH